MGTLPLSEKKKESIATGVLVLIALVMLPRTFLGDMPSSYDHSAHFFQAWQLKENLFRSGPFFWSNLWFAGYPANYFYPIGCYFAICLVHALTFGLLGFKASYAIAFGLGFFLHGYAVYYLGRRAFDRRIALLAASLFMLERGGSFIGGWFWIVQVGTWPVAIGIAFGVMATAKLGEIFERDDRRGVVIAGLLIGVALLTHPLMLLFFPVLTVVIFLAWLTVPQRRPTKAVLKDFASAAAIGGAIGAFWVLPLLSAVEFGSPYGWTWGTVGELAARLYRGQIFSSSPSLVPLTAKFSADALKNVPDDGDGLITYVTVLAFLGVPLFLRARRHLTFLTAAFSILGLIAASSTFHQIIGIDKLASYGQIEFARFVMFVKPFLFLAAAASAMAMWRGIAAAHPPIRERRTYLGLVIVGLVFSYLYLPAIGVFIDRHLLQKVQTFSTDKARPHQAKMAEWLDARAAEDPRFFRAAALGDGKDDHTLIFMGTQTKVPLFHLGFTPAVTFKFNMDPDASFSTMPSDSNEIFDALNIRYVIYKEPSQRPELKLVETFGPYRIYEYSRWSPLRYQIMHGAGSLSVKRFDAEDIEIVAAPGARGFLRLNVSYFTRWSATLDGVPIKMVPMPIDGNPSTGFITVRLDPGTYHFKYRWKAAEWLGLLALLSGLGAAAFLWRAAVATEAAKRL